MQEFEIIFYDKEDGSMPAKDFLDSLDNKMFNKMNISITALEKMGFQLREPY